MAKQLTHAEMEATWAPAAPGELLDRPFGPEHLTSLVDVDPSRYVKGTDIWHEARAYQKWKAGRAAIGIDIQVSGVEALARNFETLSGRAHKSMIPPVLEASANRLNDAIVKNIPVGPRDRPPDVYLTGTRAEITAFQEAQEEREVAAEEGISVQELRRWEAVGAFMSEEDRAAMAADFAAREEREVAAEEGITIYELRRWVKEGRFLREGTGQPGQPKRRSGLWNMVQATKRAMRIKETRHTTTFGVPLPSKEELDIESDESYYPFNVEYGTRFAAAMAPIRKAVNALEKSEFGTILAAMDAGLGILAIGMLPGLLLRKAIYGRGTPKGLMPIDYSRAQPGGTI